MRPCRCGSGRPSPGTEFCGCWVPAEWARSTWSSIPACPAKRPSRFCAQTSPVTPRFGSGSSAKPTWPQDCATPTSSASMTEANTTASCGSRWTTSTAPTQPSLLEQRYPAGMPIGHVVPIVTAVASALDYAHKKGLLHRDVKPANIIVADLDTDDPTVFLADFGIARPLDDTSGITTTNMTVGTVAYAAPEQLMGEQMDGRADQYALAATTYNLLTGSQLFPHSNPAVVISRHLSSPPPQLGNTRSDLARLDPVLAVALAKSPDDRFPRCGDFALTLAEEAVAARGGASPTARTKPSPASPSQRPYAPRPLANAHQSPLLGRGDGGRRRPFSSLSSFLLARLACCRGRRSNSTQAPRRPRQARCPRLQITTTSEHSTTLVAPPPLTTTQVPQGNGYALTGCYDSQNPPVDRPTFVGLLFCASGGLWLEDMSWTSWGPYGADGTGTSNFKVCQPSCAEGHEVPVPVVIHAWNPLPGPSNSGCPRERQLLRRHDFGVPERRAASGGQFACFESVQRDARNPLHELLDPGPPIKVWCTPVMLLTRCFSPLR